MSRTRGPIAPVASLAAACEALAKEWMDDAEKRRKLSAGDGMADCLQYCAAALREQLVRSMDADAEITAVDYAALHNRPVSTVRRWCATAALRARKDGRDWVIRRGETPPAFGNPSLQASA